VVVDQLPGLLDAAGGGAAVQLQDQADLVGDRAQLAGVPAAFAGGGGPVAGGGLVVAEVGGDAVQGVVEGGDGVGLQRGQPGLEARDGLEPVQPAAVGEPAGVLAGEAVVQVGAVTGVVWRVEPAEGAVAGEELVFAVCGVAVAAQERLAVGRRGWAPAAGGHRAGQRQDPPRG